MPFLAQRLNRIQPSPTLSLIARAHTLKAEGRDVINLGAGEPDFDTPEWIKEKAKQAITDGFTKYTPVDGTVALKKAIQAKFQKENNLTYGLDEITVANGGKQIIFNALIATVEEGDDVLIPSPYWVSYPDIVNLCGGNALIIPCQEENHFRLSPDQLIQAITPKTKWLILNSPSNPTGTVYSKEDLLSLGKVLLDYPHIYILSDDIYEHLIYDNYLFYSLASLVPELKQRILTVNGVSKAYSMTGWRIGYGAGPKTLIKAMNIIQSQSTSNACSISQAAAISALEDDQEFLKVWRNIFQRRRNIVVEALNQIPGLTCRLPEGAFYVYVNCKGLLQKITPHGKIIQNDQDVASYFLDHANVAVVHGEAFGLCPYFRLSYATTTENLLTGCQRLALAINQLTDNRLDFSQA